MLVERSQMDRAYGAAVLRQRVRRGAALRGDELADPAARKDRPARAFGQRLVELRGLAREIHGDDGEQLVLRSAEMKQQLRMLVHRAERAHRRRADAVLAQALRP